MPPYRRYSVTMEILSFPFLFARKFSSMRTHFAAVSTKCWKRRTNFLSACAYGLPPRPPQFRIRISNQGIYLMVTLFEMKTAMDANLLLPLLMLVLSLHGTSFTKCPPSEYSAPNGTHYYHTITTLLPHYYMLLVYIILSIISYLSK